MRWFSLRQHIEGGEAPNPLMRPINRGEDCDRFMGTKCIAQAQMIKLMKENHQLIKQNKELLEIKDKYYDLVEELRLRYIYGEDSHNYGAEEASSDDDSEFSFIDVDYDTDRDECNDSKDWLYIEPATDLMAANAITDSSTSIRLQLIKYHNVLRNTKNALRCYQLACIKRKWARTKGWKNGFVLPNEIFFYRKRLFVCPSAQCKYKSRSRIAMSMHVKFHYMERPFACEEPTSRKIFSAPRILVNVNQVLHCQLCSLEFISKRSLRKHSKLIHKHLDEGIYQKIQPFLFVCPFERCKRKFNNKNNVKKHIRDHTSEWPIGCKIVPHRQGYLHEAVWLKNRHKRLNTVRIRYECDDCNEMFRRTAAIRYHMREHEDPGRLFFQCPSPLCDKKFVKESAIVRHMTVHTDEDYYDCVLYSDENDLVYDDAILQKMENQYFHTEKILTTVRKKINLYVCPHKPCSYKTPKIALLKGHMSIHTDQQIFFWNGFCIRNSK